MTGVRIPSRIRQRDGAHRPRRTREGSTGSSPLSPSRRPWRSPRAPHRTTATTAAAAAAAERRRRRDVGRRPRRHGRAGQGGPEGGHAQRHRAAARLGQLRRHHQGVRGQVRHQGQSDQPDGASQDEINAANQLKGTDRAPDVFDLGQSVALPTPTCSRRTRWRPSTTSRPSSRTRTAPGSTTTAATCRSATTRRRCRTSPLDDLLGSEYKGKVALNGDPTQAGAAFSGVVMASLANGGSADDIAPGVDYFKQLKDAGNFLPVDPTSATIESGQTPVVIDWDYLNAAESPKLARWKVVVPTTPWSPATTSRRSTRTRRTRPPPGCGRSSSTATRARTSGSPAAPGRCAPTPWSGRHDRPGRVRRAARRSG